VPTKAKDHDDEVVASASKQQARKLEYTIKKGDTLSSVSRNFSVDKDDLLSWNKLSSKSALKPGQKLTIKKSGGNIQVASAAPSFKQISYTVKAGESLAEISKKFKVNVADLRKWNNVPKNSANLKPGSKLKITVDAGHTSS
jgi:membrane-bound lytic murein transglycosylase D